MPDPISNPFADALKEMDQAPAPTPEAPEAKPLSVGDRAADLVDSVNSGIGAAAHEAAEFGIKAVGSLVRGGEKITAALASPFADIDYNIATELGQPLLDANEQQAQADGSNYESKTVVGGVAQGVSQFLTGFAAVGGTLKAAGALGNVGALTKAAVTGAAADAVAFDPHQARLSDLVNDLSETHPMLKNPITEFLGANEGDSDADGRLKNALEGLVAGAVLEKTLKALGAARRYFKDKKDSKVNAELRLKEAMEADEATEIGKLKAFNNDLLATDDLGRKSFYAARESEKAAAEARGEKYEPSLEKDRELLDRVGALPKKEVGFKPDEISGGQRDGADGAPVAGGMDRVADAPLLSGNQTDDVLKVLKESPDWLESGFTTGQKPWFNYSKMDSPDGAKAAMDELSKVLPTPKTMSLPEIKKAAEGLDVNVEDMINSGKVNAGEIAQTVVAGKMLMQSVARDVAELAQKIGAAGGDEVTKGALNGEFAKSLQRLTNIQTSLKTLQSDAARATTAGRIRTADSFSPDELTAIAKAGGDISSLLPIIKEQPLWVRLMNAHNSPWINGLLSNPLTHLKNLTSNTLMTMLQPLERGIGGALRGNGAMAKEGVNLAFGMFNALQDSMRLAARSFGIPQVYNAKRGDKWAAIKGSGRSILDTSNTKMSGYDSGAPALSTENFKSLKDTKFGTFIDGIGQIANIPSRFLTAEDEFFKQINYRAQVSAAAYTSGTRLGLTGKQLSDYVADRIHTSMDDQGAAAIYRDDGIYRIKDADYDAALEQARRATFTTKAEPKSFTAWLENGAHNHPYLKLVLPFVRTPINLLKAAGIRTPVLQLASKKYRDALLGRSGERAAADATGQLVTGMTLAASAVGLAYAGMITGKGPSDPKERAALMAPDSSGKVAWAPYSFKTPTGFVSFAGFDPFSTFFGVAADFADAYGHMDPEEQNSMAASVGIALAQNITSKSYLQGLTQAMEAATQPGSTMENYMKSRVASYVPSGIKAIGSLVDPDPYMRETRTTMDAILNRLPGFSQNLPPRRNVYGEPITGRQALGPDSISPFVSLGHTEDKVKLELARLSHSFGPPSPTLNGLDLTQFKNPKGQDFYDRWQEQVSTLRVGKYTLKERLENLVTSQNYQKWKETEPGALAGGEEPRTLREVRAVIAEYRERAKIKTIKEYPEVADALLAQKKVQVRAKAGAAIPDQLLELLNFNK